MMIDSKAELVRAFERQRIAEERRLERKQNIMMASLLVGGAVLLGFAGEWFRIISNTPSLWLVGLLLIVYPGCLVILSLSLIRLNKRMNQRRNKTDPFTDTFFRE